MAEILLFFVETKIGRTLLITGAIIVGVTIGWVAFSTHYYNKGWTAAIHAIAAQDKRAIDAAKQARDTVKSCRDSGGTWDVSDGMCSH